MENNYMTKDANPFGSKGWTPERLSTQKGKTFLITGANVGTGFEATKLLASKGARVVMLCRNPQKAQTAIEQIKQEQSDADLVFIQLDLSSLESVRKASETIKKQVEKIDALICNAAIAQVAIQKRTDDGFERQMGVNYYGHFLLTGLLFEQIKNSNGRIVVVSSLGYRMGHKRIQFEDLDFDKNYHPNNTYCHSKLAQMIFAYELQRRVKSKDIDVQIHVCHPGASRTTLIREDASFMTRVLARVLMYSPLSQSAEKGSWPLVLCATEDGLQEERFYGPTERGEFVGIIGISELQEHALDRKVATQLWEISEQNTGISWNL